MKIWGKVLGTLFGFMFGRIPGAVLGFIIGHLFDRGYSQDFNQVGGFGRFFVSQEEVQNQAIFFHALFSVLGHIAKADGRVTLEEIQVASDLMDQMKLEGDTRKEAQQAFREGKEPDFPLRDILKQLHESCFGRRDILQVFLEILIQASYADGTLSKEEIKVLDEVAKHLGFKQRQLRFLISSFEAELRFRKGWQSAKQEYREHRQQRQQSHEKYQQAQSANQPTLADACKVLGVSETDDTKTIKRAYRKLMGEHHPDKLVSQGLPKQAMEMAKQKTQDIQAAYELIRKQKGF